VVCPACPEYDAYIGALYVCIDTTDVYARKSPVDARDIDVCEAQTKHLTRAHFMVAPGTTGQQCKQQRIKEGWADAFPDCRPALPMEPCEIGQGTQKP